MKNILAATLLMTSHFAASTHAHGWRPDVLQSKFQSDEVIE